MMDGGAEGHVLKAVRYGSAKVPSVPRLDGGSPNAALSLSINQSIRF